MKAGRELDAIIATKVMGIALDPSLGQFKCLGGYVVGSDCPYFSTDIASAFPIAERFHFELRPYAGGQWIVKFRKDRWVEAEFRMVPEWLK